jgi:hypothetical protein
MTAALADSINDLNHYLPVEILEVILVLLNPSDLYSFMYSCKGHQSFVLSLLNMFARYYSQNLSNHFCKNIWNLYLNLKYNHQAEQIQRLKELRFIHVLSAYNYASTDKYEQFFRARMQKYVESGRRIIETCNVPLSEIKLRYGLMHTFFNINLNNNEKKTGFSKDEVIHQMLILINTLTSIQFSFLILLFKNYPDIQGFITKSYGAFHLIKLFEITPYTNFNEIIGILDMTKSTGGSIMNAISIYTLYGARGYNKYIYALKFGFTEEDAHDFGINPAMRTTIEQLKTFKALIPIIGYKFAKYFIIDIPYNIDNHPHFLSVVSRYYSMGYVCVHKCAKLLRDPSEENMGKLKAKRRRLE